VSESFGGHSTFRTRVKGGGSGGGSAAVSCAPQAEF